MKTKTHIGVVVGRFQTPYLHQGHQHLLNHVAKKHKNRLIVLGVSVARGVQNNPLDIRVRSAMIQTWETRWPFPAQIRTLNDQESDSRWSRSLDKLIFEVFPQVGVGSKVILYGGRDSFISHYSGQFETKIVPSKITVSSTELRDQVLFSNLPKLESPIFAEGYANGQIAASQWAYPQVLPTVDIAVTRHANPDGTGPLELLLGWKTGDTSLRFPGGFVDPRDENLELAAKRELSEEAPGIAVEGDMTYICSTLVEDWRYPGPLNRIMTTLMHGAYTFGHTQAGDDLEGLTWVDLSTARKRIRQSHRYLYDRLVAHLEEKNLYVKSK